MYDKIRTILAADSNVTDECPSSKFFDEEVAPNTTVPFIRISAIEGEVNNTKNGASGLDEERYAVQCFGKHLTTTNSEIGARSLADLVRTSLDAHTATVGGTVLRIYCDDTGSGWSEKAKDGPIKAYEYEFVIEANR